MNLKMNFNFKFNLQKKLKFEIKKLLQKAVEHQENKEKKYQGKCKTLGQKIFLILVKF